MKERGKTDAPVFFRTYTGMRTILHKPVADEEIAGFRVVKANFPVGRVNNTIVAVKLDEQEKR